MRQLVLYPFIVVALVGSLGIARIWSQQPGEDRCQRDSKPVACYEAELRSLGKARGQLERDASDAKAQVTSQAGEVAQLRAQLAAASIPNPAYAFLIGTWCPEQVPGSAHIEQFVVTLNGRDVLITNGPSGMVAAHLAAAPPDEWETSGGFQAAPNSPPVKITTHGKKLDDKHLQYTTTQALLTPSPGAPPPPAPYVGTMVRCN